ncbi:hypothetical protein [Burkholderia sp. A2]|uniref:hypothetical protein n=1 Tax=Burkholderia sp. A2 TaxID=236253 RepID=UPI00114CF8C2|nr:hypothetical protein [Burkholderia sp. A2]
MRDSASMPSLSPDVVDRVLRACLGGDDETLSRHAAFMGGRCIPVTGLHTCPERKLTLDGQPHAIKARGSRIGNDNEALLSAARIGPGILARDDWLTMQDIDGGNPTSGLPRRCRLTPEC